MPTLKERLTTQLTKARHTSERLLEAFQSPKDWTHQVHANANHALWFAGHLGSTDNFFISVLAPDRVKPRKDFSEKFGMKSQPTSDPAAYPPVEEVLAYMRERRETLLDVLSKLSDQELNRPSNLDSKFATDLASLLEMAVYHEGLHAGQVTVARRALGHPPLVG